MVVLGCWVSHVVIGKTCVVQVVSEYEYVVRVVFLWQLGL